MLAPLLRHVATHVLVRNLNVAPVRLHERRIEVIANGLPLWGGVQLAVDTTLVSPLTCNVVREAARPGQLCMFAKRARPGLTQSLRPAAAAGSSCSALRLADAGAARPP